MAADVQRSIGAAFKQRFARDNGAVFEAVAADDAAALRLALEACPADVSRELAGRFNGQSNGQQPLHFAVIKGASTGVLQALLAAGASVNAWCGKQTFCVPLHYAAGKGHLAATELLLSRGADPTTHFVGSDASDPPFCDFTAQEMAAANGHVAVAALLAAAEASWTAEMAAEAAEAAGRRWPRAVDEALRNLEDLCGISMDDALEEANGAGGGHAVRQGLPLLSGYATALGLPRPALVACLRGMAAAPGSAPLSPHWREVMTPEELQEVEA
jgi:hypothetical protein